MRAGGVGEDLDSVKTHVNVRTNLVSMFHVPTPSIYLFGVKSSSQVSTPMHESLVLMTASPNGTLY